MKVPQNSPCPCGSGIKFKKCCGRPSIRSLPVQIQSPDVPVHFRGQIERFEKERQAYGDVKPIISANFKGHKFVAVGDAVYWSDKWKTFPDFLFDYIKFILGREWWMGEARKAALERHQIVQWSFHAWECQKTQQKAPNGMYAMAPDGIMSAYLLLAYELYVLRHHQKLQNTVVRRLKDVRQFQGARYELFVAATLIRTGCSLEFEDESDVTAKHPELVATHGKTGTVIDVEAKSRHRSGVLGHPGDAQEPSDLKLGLHRLLNRGSRKARTRPLVIFVDLNLPPQCADPADDQIINDIRAEISRVAFERKGEWPFSLAVVTNCPHHYGQLSQSDPVRWGYITEPDLSDWPHQRDFADDIEVAIQQYGNIPNFFPCDFDDWRRPNSAPPVNLPGSSSK